MSNDNIKQQIKEKVEQVLRAKFPDTMTGVDIMPSVRFYWRPNNYRGEIPFNAQKFKEHYSKERLLSKGIKISNYETKFTKKIDNITLMLDVPKKTFNGKLTCIYSLKDAMKKMWYEVKGQNVNDINGFIDSKVEQIKEKLIKQAKIFTKEIRGILNINSFIWRRHEDAIKGEDFIDSLDSSLIIHDTYFKKVYSDTVEFKNPAFVKKFISNRVTEELAPEITKELNDLKVELLKDRQEVWGTLNLFKEQINSHLDLIQEWRKEVEERRKPFWKRWLQK